MKLISNSKLETGVLHIQLFSVNHHEVLIFEMIDYGNVYDDMAIVKLLNIYGSYRDLPVGYAEPYRQLSVSEDYATFYELNDDEILMSVVLDAI